MTECVFLTGSTPGKVGDNQLNFQQMGQKIAGATLKGEHDTQGKRMDGWAWAEPWYEYENEDEDTHIDRLDPHQTCSLRLISCLSWTVTSSKAGTVILMV